MTDITCRTCIHFNVCKISGQVEGWIKTDHFQNDWLALKNIIAEIASNCRVYENNNDIIINAMRELISQASVLDDYRDAAAQMGEMLDKMQEGLDGNQCSVCEGPEPEGCQQEDDS